MASSQEALLRNEVAAAYDKLNTAWRRMDKMGLNKAHVTAMNHAGTTLDNLFGETYSAVGHLLTQLDKVI